MMLRSLFAALSLALLCSPAAAQAPLGTYPNQPAVGAPKPYAVPRTQNYTLPNGMQITLIPSGLAPKTTMTLAIAAGNLNDGTSTWLADLTGAMLKEGANGRSAGQLAQAAANMGGALDVGVGWGRTAISIAVLKENGPDAIALLADVARRPDFATDAFARIQQDKVRDLAVTLSQPQPLAVAVMARAVYGTAHPYGRVYPTEKQLKAFTIEDVKRFYSANFGAERAHLYIAGQFDAGTMRRAIEAAFDDWESGPARLILAPNAQLGPSFGRRVLLVDRPGAPQSTLQLAFAAPQAGTPGDIAFRVTDALLSGAFNSRITTNIREEKGYTYSPGSSIQQRPGDALWIFEADVTSDVTGKSLHEIFKEIKELQAVPPPRDEAAGMSTWLSGVFVLRHASPAGLIGELASRDALGLPASWLDSYIPSVLSVGAADIQASAKERLTLDSLILVVVGDLRTVTPQLKALPELRGAKFAVVKAE